MRELLLPHTLKISLNTIKFRYLSKTLGICLIVTLFSSSSYSQLDSIEQKYLTNDSIRFTILFTSRSAIASQGTPVIKNHIDLKMPKDVKELLMKQDSTFWIEHLRDEKSDWATNLVLYYLYDLEAGHIRTFFQDRDRWVKIKSIEIEDWQKFFLNMAVNRKKTKKRH